MPSTCLLQSSIPILNNNHSVFFAKKKSYVETNSARPSERSFLNRPSSPLFMTQYQRLNSLSGFYQIRNRSSLQHVLGKRGNVKTYLVIDILYRRTYVNLCLCRPYLSKDLGEIRNRISLIPLTYCEFHKNRCSKSHTLLKVAN